MPSEVKAQDTTSLASIKTVNEAATQSRTLLAEMQQAALDAGTTLDGIYQDAADAKTAADSALVSLSTVEDVVGVLNWITAHGTMTSQSGGTFVDGQVYFVQDQNGDYVVQNIHYSLVAEPKAEDIDDYYVLTVDESVQNYVATHIVVDSEGLWIIPDAGGNKVLIATGSGSTYTTSGTYIIDDNRNVIAMFGSTVQLGNVQTTHITLSQSSTSFFGYDGRAFARIGSTNDGNTGLANIIEAERVKNVSGPDISGYGIIADNHVVDLISAKLNGTTTSVTVGRSGYTIVCSAATAGDFLEIEYTTDSVVSSASFGTLCEANGNGTMAYGYSSEAYGKGSIAGGNNSSAYGDCAVAEGIACTSTGMAAVALGQNSNAIGDNSITLGTECEASGISAVALGQNSNAVGDASHAQNFHTIANYEYQTAIGAYNSGSYYHAFEIGNGTDDNARSDAFTVAWDGSVEFALDTTAQSGDDYDIYTALTSLGWVNDVIV